MPRYDGTGPNGAGPMSGWGLGRCGGRGVGCGPAGYAGGGRGRGAAHRRGPGAGYGYGFRGGVGAQLGWFPAGAVSDGAGGPLPDRKKLLELRAAALREELELTESLLRKAASGDASGRKSDDEDL